MKYIYLDSNAIWIMKSNHNQYDADFDRTICRIRKKYKTPFSEAHFLDLAAGDSPDTHHLIEEDLRFLKKVTNSCCIAFDEQSILPPEPFFAISSPFPAEPLPRLIYGPIKNINQEYEKSFHDYKRKYDKDISEFNDTSVECTKSVVDLKKIPQRHPMLDLLHESNGILDSEVLQSFINMLYKDIHDPSFYKKFREHVDLGIRKKLKNSLMSNNLEMMKHAKIISSFLEAKTHQEMADRLIPAMESLGFISESDYHKKKWPEKLVGAYSVLDFHKDMFDKINDGNKPSNLFIDAKHIMYAASAEYFVTGDKHFLEKANIIFSAFNIKTKLCDIYQFKSSFHF